MTDTPSPMQVFYPLDDLHFNRLAAKRAAHSRISMQHVIGTAATRERVLGQSVNPAQLCALFEGDTVLGILGFSVNGRDFANISWQDFTAEFGLLSGLFRLIGYHAIKRLYYGPGLYIAAFWINPRRRGGGFGKTLFTTLRRIAEERQMPITTDVKIDNPLALRFYEKQGFQPQKTLCFTSLLPRMMGYQRVYWDPRAR